MPRNASGVYTLPAGNPVVSSTPIETSWANPTLSDIGVEITNSLDRQGRGGMLVPFQNVDGTTPAPGITFTSEPTMGFFRNGSGDMQATVAGVPQMRWQSTGVQVWTGSSWAKVLSALADGPVVISSKAVDQVPLTVVGFAGQTASTFVVQDSIGTGRIRVEALRNVFGLPPGNTIASHDFYSDGTTDLAARFGAIDTRILNDNMDILSGSNQTGIGIQFVGNQDVGQVLMYLKGVFGQTGDYLRIVDSSAGNLYRFQPSSLLGRPGAAGAPGYSFITDTDTGMYLVGAGNLGFAVGGAARMTISSAAVNSTVPVRASNGTLALPTYGFSSDPDTGMYWAGSGDLRFSANGVQGLRVTGAACTAKVFNATG